jgi:hypothetical protein
MSEETGFRKTTINISADVLEKAKKYKINISEVAELAIVKILREKYGVIPESLRLKQVIEEAKKRRRGSR